MLLLAIEDGFAKFGDGGCGENGIHDGHVESGDMVKDADH